MKIKLSTLIPTVNHEKSTREAEPAKEKPKPFVESVEPVETAPAQVNPDKPVAVPTTRRKPVDDNRGNLFLPDIPKESAKTPEPETPSIPKAASTDRRETEQMREKPRIYCFRCRQPTTHAESPCDLKEYAANWLMYVCRMCGLKAYARKDLEMKEGEERL